MSDKNINNQALLNQILSKIDQLNIQQQQPQQNMHEKNNDNFKITQSNLNPNASDFIPSFSRTQINQPAINHVFDINSYLDVEGFDIAADIIREAELLVSEDQDNNKNIDREFSSQIYDETENEDEFLELLEMQDECELEMLKDYYKSQNPELFEEVFFNYNNYPIQADEFVYFNELDYVISQLDPNANEFIPKKYLNSN